MDSQSEPASTVSPPSPAPLSVPLQALEPLAPERPRVWPVFLAFGLALVTLLVAGALLAGIAVAVELARTGVKPQDTEALNAVVEKLKLMPWLHVAGVVMSSTTTLAAALIGAWLSPRPWRERLRLQAGAPLPPWVWAAAVMGCCALGQAMESATILTGAWDWTTSLKGIQATSAASPGTFALLMLFGALVAGTAEELFFRGYVQSRLVERWGRTAGIATAASLFGLMHMDPIHGPIALVMGLFLGWLAERTGSLRLPVCVHILNNAVSFLLTRYSVPSSELSTSVHVTMLIVCPLLVVGALVLVRRSSGVAVPAGHG
ncbi:CPBP family intramembrane glutamic endopeptidase [Pyxidicoccus sp. MSG2]|uniref:CPBP family intramembrane glutamic endopeptidase n=1 Tax=Pyxidicoccus sp. MSG2 TaxID=2996790 RepID=UPI00226F2DAD|nr:CPBP family intramembrane glutamic endopeptidase [Pyxidicoccus sp. MSG2]MCY1016123.1 CPBP family intramembrane metalloprotease [Pyxidicoccus sp. MSG2]